MNAPRGIRILGVDTALRNTGVAVIEAAGSRLTPVAYDVIRNPSGRKHTECLLRIEEDLSALIAETAPREAAIEGVFFCKNVRTALVLGQARGVVLAACARSGLPVCEYSPRRVKQAVVGTGTASKEQVAHMVMRLLGLDRAPPADAADALALAICHAHACRGVRREQTV